MQLRGVRWRTPSSTSACLKCSCSCASSAIPSPSHPRRTRPQNTPSIAKSYPASTRIGAAHGRDSAAAGADPDQIAIKHPVLDHRVALDPQQIVRRRQEQPCVQDQDIGQRGADPDRGTGGHPYQHRHPQQLGSRPGGWRACPPVNSIRPASAKASTCFLAAPREASAQASAISTNVMVIDHARPRGHE